MRAFQTYKKIEYYSLSVVEKLENQKISLTGWLAGFFAVVYLRMFLEIFSTGKNYLFPEKWGFFLFHTPLSFLFVILFLILVAYFFTKEKIEKIARISLFGVFILLLVPILDLAFSQGQGEMPIKYCEIYYTISPFELPGLFWGWLTSGPAGLFFLGKPDHPFAHFEHSFGGRIEAQLIILFFLWYIFLKTKNILKVSFGLFLFYLALFIFGTFPYIWALLLKIPPALESFYNASVLNSAFEWNKILFSLFFILTVFLAVLWFYIYNKKKCLAVLKNLKPGLALQNLAMLGFGIYLCKIPFLSFTFFDGLLLALAALSLLLYQLSRGQFLGEEFKNLNNILLALSFISAFIVGYAFFVLLFLRALIVHIYSAYPFCLKRFPIIASFLLALVFLLTIFSGYLLNTSNSILSFPKNLALFILIAFTLGFMAKDIKDYEGDKKEKVYTLPIIFGQRQGKIIIGSLIFFVFLLTPFFFFQHFNELILPSIFAGILSFWLLNRKKYRETPLFLIYFSYGLFFALTVF